jgi:hypothetical protein
MLTINWYIGRDSGERGGLNFWRFRIFKEGRSNGVMEDQTSLMSDEMKVL